MPFSSPVLVQPSHGLMDVRVPPRPPELIGSWMLCMTMGSSNTTTSVASGVGRVLKNDVFVAAAAAPPPPSASAASSSSAAPNSGDDERGLVRLPPARAGGVVEVSLGGPPAPTLKGTREVWGFSLRVDPLFPSEFGGAHPWLARQFEAFTGRVWGEDGQAHASNAELIRYCCMLDRSCAFSFSAVLDRAGFFVVVDGLCRGLLLGTKHAGLR